jgi:hypothetical protein
MQYLVLVVECLGVGFVKWNFAMIVYNLIGFNHFVFL